MNGEALFTFSCLTSAITIFSNSEVLSSPSKLMFTSMVRRSFSFLFTRVMRLNLFQCLGTSFFSSPIIEVMKSLAFWSISFGILSTLTRFLTVLPLFVLCFISKKHKPESMYSLYLTLLRFVFRYGVQNKTQSHRYQNTKNGKSSCVCR